MRFKTLREINNSGLVSTQITINMESVESIREFIRRNWDMEANKPTDYTLYEIRMKSGDKIVTDYNVARDSYYVRHVNGNNRVYVVESDISNNQQTQ